MQAYGLPFSVYNLKIVTNNFKFVRKESTFFITAALTQVTELLSFLAQNFALLIRKSTKLNKKVAVQLWAELVYYTYLWSAGFVSLNDKNMFLAGFVLEIR